MIEDILFVIIIRVACLVGTCRTSKHLQLSLAFPSASKVVYMGGRGKEGEREREGGQGRRGERGRERGEGGRIELLCV